MPRKSPNQTSQGTERVLAGGTSVVGSHEGWGSGSMKGDGKGRGSLGGWEGECHQRVVRGGAVAPNGTVSPSKAVGTDCSGQSTQSNQRVLDSRPSATFWLYALGRVSSLSEPHFPHLWNGPDHLHSGLSG